MLNDTLWEYILIRSVVFALQSIGPLCTGYALSLLVQGVLLAPQDGPRPLQLLSSLLKNLAVFQLYCFAEALFYIFMRLYRQHLQAEAMHPPLRSKDNRKALFEKVRSEIHDPVKFLSGWFRGAEIENIGREDLKEFLDWAFWEGRATRHDEKELEEVTQNVEEMMGGKKFKQGRGTAKALRLTLDPIEMDHRSLFWYMIIMLVDTATHLRMLRYGMKFHSTRPTSLGVFPPRPLAYATSSGDSSAHKMSYWLRPHTSRTRLPILYLHGIGVGLHPHVEFLHELDLTLNDGKPDDDKVGILSIEVLQISSRLTHSILNRVEFLEQLTKVLDQNEYKRFVLLSHSYGSVLSTHMLTDETMASRIAATFLIDPVTILLHMPDVAYNFTVREPKKANQWQLWYFASKDPGVAHVLGRHFHWSQNVLWRDHIMKLVDNGMRMTVSLASKDLIVDTEAVGAYLTQDEVPDPQLITDKTNQDRMELKTEGKVKRRSEHWKERKFTGKGLDVLWWDGLDHAQVFDQAETREKVVRVLAEYVKTT